MLEFPPGVVVPVPPGKGTPGRMTVPDVLKRPALFMTLLTNACTTALIIESMSFAFTSWATLEFTFAWRKEEMTEPGVVALTGVLSAFIHCTWGLTAPFVEVEPGGQN